MRVPMRRTVAALLLAATTTACGATPSPTATGSPGAATLTSPGPSVAVLSAAPAVGPVPGATVSAWRPQVSFDPQSIGAKAAQLGDDLRAAVDAKGTYGAIVADEEAALEQAESQALTQLDEQIKAKLGAGAFVPSAALASVRAAPSPGQARPAQGMLGVTYALAIIALVTGISTYDPRTGDVPEVSMDLPFNDAASGVSAEAKLSGNSTGGVVSFTLTLTGSVSRADASGQQVSTAGQSSFTYTINPCPDASGSVSGTVDVKDAETTFSTGRLTLGWNITGHTDYHAQVDDQAEAGATTTKTTWDEKLTRTGDQSHESDIALTAGDTFGPQGQVDASASSLSVDNVDGTLTMDQVKNAASIMMLFGETTPFMMVMIARDVWRGGKCFEVRPDPKQADVDPKSQTSINVTVYHWVDKADVQLPVKATLSGPKQIDPSGQAVTSPAKFTYTAAGPGTTGTVTYKVTSKRGIGEATGTYTVKGNLVVDIAGKYSENAGGLWLVNLKVTATAIQVSAKEDGSLTASGDVTLKGTAKASLLPCTATVTETVGVQVRGQLQGPPDAQVYHLQFGPTSTHNVHTVVSCPNITAPATTGDYFGQWSTALGYVDIPAAGGTISASGSTGGLAARQASGTFTAKTK
jgi:hypothetical protein